MNVVDSSGWLEYFSGGPNADSFASPLQAVAAMQKGQVVDLTTRLAMSAAKLSIKQNLLMADSIIYATAKVHKCMVWAQDSDFKNLPGVKFFPK